MFQSDVKPKQTKKTSLYSIVISEICFENGNASLYNMLKYKLRGISVMFHSNFVHKCHIYSSS